MLVNVNCRKFWCPIISLIKLIWSESYDMTHIQCTIYRRVLEMATSMLVTDVGDEMCWWQFEDVGYGFGHFDNQHPQSLNISVGHRHPKDVTNCKSMSPNILKLSPTVSQCHQHDCSPMRWPKKSSSVPKKSSVFLFHQFGIRDALLLVTHIKKFRKFEFFDRGFRRL